MPVWACLGSVALATAVAAWPQGTATCAPYHPEDDEGADADARDAAPQVLAARAPLLTTAVSAGPKGSSAAKGSGMLTLISAPSLILFASSSSSSNAFEPTPLPDLMAAEVSAAVFKGAADPSTAVSLCASYGAHGLDLLPATDAAVVRLSKTRQPESAYSRPAVPILEQFGDPQSPREQFGDPQSPGAEGGGRIQELEKVIELVPTHHVRVAVRTRDDVDAPTVREATLLPRGTESIDGVQLRLGDRVVLERQQRDGEEGGRYLVVRGQTGATGDRNRLVLQWPVALDPPRPFRTTLERLPASEMSGGAQWQWRFAFDGSNHAPSPLPFLRAGDAVAWLPLPGAPVGVVDRVVATAPSADPSAGRRGGVTVEVVLPAASVVASEETAKYEHDWFHPLSTCGRGAADVDAGITYGGAKKASGSTATSVPVPRLDATRQLCEGSGGVWDRPCEHDAECPFIRADTELARGRCLAGRCELPLGVRPVGFKHVRVGDRPVCRCPGAEEDDGEDAWGPSVRPMPMPMPMPSLRAASRACCGLPGATPAFALEFA